MVTRRLAWGVVAAVVAGCGGAAGAPLVLSEPASSEDCAYGGVVITVGEDADGDGRLVGDEVQERTVICDGAPGQDAASLVLQLVPADEGDCPEGGRRLRAGYDTTGDGVPDSSVVEELICDGPEGRASQAVTAQGDLPCDCAAGGTELSFGYDTSGDGVLDEVTHRTILCVPAPGGIGPAWPSELPCEPFVAFSGWGTGTGSQVWLSDGTPGGTRMLPPVHTGLHEPFSVSLCTAFGFSIDDCDAFERYICELSDSQGGHCGLPASAAPDRFILYDGYLYFTARDGVHGRELWRSDGVDVERVTDINPNGSSFREVEPLSDEAARVRMAVYDGALYFVATNGSSLSQSYNAFLDGLAYQLYRFTDAQGLSEVPFADPTVEWVRDYLVASEDSLFVTANVGDDLDVFRYRGSGAAEGIGVPPLGGTGGNALMHLDAARDGLYFRVRVPDAEVAGVYPTRFGPFGVALGPGIDGPPRALSARALLNGQMCGVGDNRFYCYSGRAGTQGVTSFGTTDYLGAQGEVVIDDRWLCFRASVAGSDDRMFCSDGVDAPVSFAGTGQSVPLGGADGVLYHRCEAGEGLCALDLDAATIAQVDDVASPGGPVLPFTQRDTLLYISLIQDGLASELRYVDLASGTAETLDLRADGPSYPQRVAHFSPAR